jgi:PH/SEC7 domain-containing protein
MFRNGGGATPRTPGPTPPSAYRSGLQPVASGDLLADGRVVSRRASRTDLDFEQILLTEETVRIKEGPDISLLGVDSPVASRTPRNKNHHIQPQTPAVIPPTPASKPEPSDSESGQRRSIFRTSGTASSPDLATLARRAKEKARAEEFSKSVKATPSQLAISSDMLPANDSRSRPRSATASNRKFADSQVRLASTPVTPTSSKPSKDKGFNDWVNMSPTKDPSYIKVRL